MNVTEKLSFYFLFISFFGMAVLANVVAVWQVLYTMGSPCQAWSKEKKLYKAF